MTTDYKLSGTKIFIRRLFKQDIDLIIHCYETFDTLYFNPMTPTFANELLLRGEIWGAFVGSKIVGCCYFFNANSEFFKAYNAYDVVADFTDNLEKYLYMGYIYADTEYVSGGIYQAFYNIAQVQGFRQGEKYILHSVPAKIPCDLHLLFENGFKLVKLRGMDNLVVHYIFVKSLFTGDVIYNTNDYTTQLVCVENTKMLSKYLEHSYCGVELLYKDDGAVLVLKQFNNL
ncbi:MAG: hypothetical protein RSE24_06355 [Oscillospiraceae bacterium]